MLPGESTEMQVVVIPVKAGPLELSVCSVFVESLRRWIEGSFEKVFVENSSCDW